MFWQFTVYLPSPGVHLILIILKFYVMLYFDVFVTTLRTSTLPSEWLALLQESRWFVWVSFFLAAEGFSPLLTCKLENALHISMQMKCEVCQRVVVVLFVPSLPPATQLPLYIANIFLSLTWRITFFTAPAGAAVFTVNYFCDLQQLRYLYLYHNVLLWGRNGKGFFVLWRS
jgi:hypothetical protein